MKPLLLATVEVVGVTFGLAVAAHQAAGERVALGMAEDHLPNATAEDWVTYADHVVVVTPTKEIVVEPKMDSVTAESGLINREVTFRVDEVVWTSETSK